jgi:hypothetical protein
MHTTVPVLAVDAYNEGFPAGNDVDFPPLTFMFETYIFLRSIAIKLQSQSCHGFKLLPNQNVAYALNVGA